MKKKRNDYSQAFTKTGWRPQNFIRQSDYLVRFQEYPKLKELIRLKDEIFNERATDPQYIQADLKNFDLANLGTRFDVILIDPPWEEYFKRGKEKGITQDNLNSWTVQEIYDLRIDLIAENPSFLWL